MGLVWDFIVDGGFVMYGLLLPLSIVALGLIIERFVAYVSMRSDLPALFEKLKDYARRGAWDEAVRNLRTEKKLGDRLAADMLEKRAEGLPAMRSAAASEVDLLYLPLLERRVALLSTIAKAAPMLGLFGTVQGMIGAFGKIAASQQGVNPKDLAYDIAIALNTTFGGLAIAIPIVFALTYIRKMIHNYEIDFERLSQYVQRLVAGAEGQTHA
jgi:biopolymer transport protein ExbB